MLYETCQALVTNAAMTAALERHSLLLALPGLNAEHAVTADNCSIFPAWLLDAVLDASLGSAFQQNNCTLCAVGLS